MLGELENENLINKSQHRRRLWPWLLGFILIVAAICGLLFYKTGFTFSQMGLWSDEAGGFLPILEDVPRTEKNQDIINILLLGLRGEGDPNGGLLTDTMMLVSIKKSTNQVAMISIPRDLYMVMPAASQKEAENPIREKINFAYALGEERSRGSGPLYAKAIVSKITGLYIDYYVVADFVAFKEIVDIVGGVDVILDKPFSETAQFSKDILLELPAGKNHLNGDEALYFVRSRYSTNDFDRARRQQLVMLAIKDKVMTLGTLFNPVKMFGLLDTMGRHIRTDMGLADIQDVIGLAKNSDFKSVKHKVFDTTEQGLLYATTSDSGAYILLPVGDNFEKMRQTSKNIF